MKIGPVKQLALKLAALMLACGILGGCAGGAQVQAPASSPAPQEKEQELVLIREEAEEAAAETAEAVTEAAAEAAEAVTEATAEAVEEAAEEVKAAAEPAGQQKKAESKKQEAEPPIDEDGVYTAKDDVALYLYTYHKLPSNFITKKKAKKLGWEGGNLEPYAPGKCIGGDYFGNYEGLLPEDEEYHECDIDTLGKKKRGAKRIIWSEDWDIYYTGDHYETFTLLYEGE